jgi:peptidyl-prolyl cis-trans isomerase C
MISKIITNTRRSQTMKFPRNFLCLQLLAAISLVTFQAGQAFSGDAKPQPQATVKAEAPAKTATTVKASPAEPVVKVNGTMITREELDRAIKVMAGQNRMGQQPAAPTKEAEDAVLNQLISAELLYQAGAKLGMADLDKQVADKLAQGKAKFPNDAAYENALKSSDLTPKSLEELIRKDTVINNLIVKEIVPKVSVSDADAKKFYDDNKDKFKRGEQIRASHILCQVDPQAKAEEKKKAKEKAEGLLKQIKAGKDFAELAKTNSDCPSKEQGGDLNFFGKGQMVPAFESAAFALKPGEVSDVVETQFGYHIIKVTEKKAAGETKFDEVKPRIVDYLKNEKIQKAINDYVTQLREKAKIEKMAKK